MGNAQHRRTHACRLATAAALALLAFVGVAAHAATDTSFGEPGGEGAGPFGGLQQAAEANLYTGAFTLSVPILIPPGRPLLTPDLRLKYSSSDGDGPFGRGWTLPLGQVQRNTKHGVPRCIGTTGSNFTDDFALALNGSTYELVLKTGNTYRSKIDSSFLEATKNVGANTWEVVDRGGRRYRFGSVPEARLWKNSDTFLNSATCSFTSVWALTEIEDSYGNLIRITYAAGLDSLVPEKVEYGGTVSAVHPFQVRFTTLAHPSPLVFYRQGVPEVLDRLVGEIVVEARLSQGAGFTVVRTYDLAYNHESSFTGCANAHKALLCQVSADDGRPAQTFEYATSAFGLGLSTDSQSDPHGINSLRAINGSGDTVRSVMDMNGDGFTDLIDSDDLGDTKWAVHYGGPNGITNVSSDWHVPSGTGGSLEGDQMRVQSGYKNGISRTLKETVDLTGDGIPDFVDAETTPYWKVHPGYCSGTCGFTSSYLSWWAPEAELGENQKDQGGDRIRVWKQLVDMNGDGRPDLLIASSSEWLVYLNKGDGFATASVDFSSAGEISNQIKDGGEWRVLNDLFDFNGDGLPDKVYAVLGGNRVHLNNGQGFDAGITMPTLGGTEWVRLIDNGNDQSLIDYVDVNADGLPDRVRYYTQGPSTWQVQINRGTSLASSIPWPGGSQGPIRDQSNEGSAKIDLIDYNGDGFTDRVDASASTWNIKLGGPTSGPSVRPFVLLHARNSLGGDTHVRYEPSTHFANQRLPFIVWVTTGIRRTDGICTPPANVDLFSAANPCIGSGNELVQTHEYEGGLWDGVDREFRGFERVVSTDADGSTREVTYSQADVTRGMKLLEETVAGPHTVTRDAYVWGTQADGARTQVYLKEQKRELLAVPNDPQLNQCSYDRNAAPDEFGRISTSCSLDCAGAPATPGSCANPTTGQITTTTTWANPQSGWAVRERPSSVKTEYKNAASSIVKLIEKTFRYDGAALGAPLAVGSVNRGALTSVETYLDQSPIGLSSNPIVLQQVDSFGNVILVRDPLGNDTTSNYAASPYSLYAATTTNALGHQTGQTVHLAYGKPSSETGPNADVTAYTYDAMGRLTCEAFPGDSCSGAPGGARAYSYVYPTGGTFEGRLSYVEMHRKEPQHPSGYRTSRVYQDALGRERLASVERIIGTGTALSTVVVDQQQFDEVGRVERAYAPYVKSGSVLEYPTAAFTAYDYNLNGLGVSDPLARPHIVTPPDGNATTTSFKGRRTQVFDPLNNEIRIDADAFGRETTRDLYDQGTLRMRQDYAYDGLGRILAKTVYATPASRGGPATVAMTFDTLGREIQRIDPDSGAWVFGYDAAGNLVFEDDPKTGQHIQACYDPVDRITKRYVFLTGDTYVANGCSQPTPGATYSYDSVAGGNHGIGRLTAVSDPSGGESWVYDLRGNVTSNAKTVLGKTAVSDSSYDPVDRLETLWYFGTERVTYAYRADGQFKSLSSGATTYVSDSGYDLFGRLELLRHGNGTDDSVTFYDGSENFRLERITTLKSGVTTPYLDLQYHYNALGQIEQIDDLRNPATDLSNSAIYAYDGLGRLTSNDWLAGGTYDESFAYDSVGNLTLLGGKTLSYPGRPHQALSRSDGAEMLYDSNGSRSRKITASETQGYVYDGLGRLSTVNLSPGPTDPPTKIVQFTYDAGGTRVARAVASSGQWAPPRRYFNPFVESYNGTITKYYYAGGRLVASKDVSSNVLSEVLPGSPAQPLELPRLPLAVAACLLGLMLLLLLGPGRRRIHIGVNVAPARAAAVAIAVLLACVPVLMGPQCGGGGGGPPPIRHFHFDHLGSLQAMSDGAGSLSRQSRYRPYGTVRGRYDGAGVSAPATEKARHEFTGYETEIDTGLEFAHARFYDPDLGQFLSHDPAAALPSPYAYTHGDPINSSDPSGEEPITIAIIAVLTVLLVAKVAYNYARSGGDWGFALEAGVQTPVPTERSAIGPIKSTAPGYNGYGSSPVSAGTEIAGIRINIRSMLALNAAISAAQGEQTQDDPVPTAAYAEQEGVYTAGIREKILTCPFSKACRATVRQAVKKGVEWLKKRAASAKSAQKPKYTTNQMTKYEQQLEREGRSSLERTQRRLESRVQEHRADLERYKAEGGYTSSVEKEIRNFDGELEAIREILARP